MTEPIYNTDFYYVRTDINEFLREHPFVSDLYDATLQCLFGLGESKEQALHVSKEKLVGLLAHRWQPVSESVWTSVPSIH